jgi:hypothetical protein
MPGIRFIPLVGCAAMAAATRTALANSKMRLFQAPFLPAVGTPRADYLAAEADYSGYLAGGIVMAAWFAPILAPYSGYEINSPMVQFAFDSGVGAVQNVISGGWVETAGGVLYSAFTFDENIGMGADGNGFPLSVSIPFPTGL